MRPLAITLLLFVCFAQMTLFAGVPESGKNIFTVEPVVLGSFAAEDWRVNPKMEKMGLNLTVMIPAFSRWEFTLPRHLHQTNEVLRQCGVSLNKVNVISINKIFKLIPPYFESEMNESQKTTWNQLEKFIEQTRRDQRELFVGLAIFDDLGIYGWSFPEWDFEKQNTAKIFENTAWVSITHSTEDGSLPNIFEHEISHVLGLQHADDKDNLMHGTNTRGNNKLTKSQCRIILKSKHIFSMEK